MSCRIWWPKGTWTLTASFGVLRRTCAASSHASFPKNFEASAPGGFQAVSNSRMLPSGSWTRKFALPNARTVGGPSGSMRATAVTRLELRKLTRTVHDQLRARELRIEPDRPLYIGDLEAHTFQAEIHGLSPSVCCRAAISVSVARAVNPRSFGWGAWRMNSGSGRRRASIPQSDLLACVRPYGET